MVVDLVEAPDEFSMLLLTQNVHRLHNIAITIELTLQLVVDDVSYVFVVVVVVLLMQIHCQEFPENIIIFFSCY